MTRADDAGLDLITRCIHSKYSSGYGHHARSRGTLRERRVWRVGPLSASLSRCTRAALQHRVAND